MRMGLHDASPSQVAQFRQTLLGWYDKNKRSMPWRDIANTEKDDNIKAYAVWVSEVMLQQTQVATVEAYFQRWMHCWPTVQHLQTARLEDVNKVWSGLGYYSRARRLHQAAQQVCGELDGRVPDTAAALRRLPGVGRYTAAAVASIAFGRVEPLVDGNVARVLTRLRVVGADSQSKAVTEWLWREAAALVDPGRPGDFNQALMELGATVCTPKAPSCGDCPVRTLCTARLHCQPAAAAPPAAAAETGAEPCASDCPLCLPEAAWEPRLGVLNYPRKRRRTAPQAESVAVCVLHQRRQLFLLAQRPAQGLLASLWEFPGVTLDETEPTDTAVEAALRALLLPHLPPPAAPLHTLADFTHLFSHRRRRYRVRAAALPGRGRPPPPAVPAGYRAARWMSRDELLTADVPVPVRKVLRAFDAEFGSPPTKRCQTPRTPPPRQALPRKSRRRSHE